MRLVGAGMGTWQGCRPRRGVEAAGDVAAADQQDLELAVRHSDRASARKIFRLADSLRPNRGCPSRSRTATGTLPSR